VQQDDLPPALAHRLRELHFEGDVHAMPEGTVFFADEPIVRVSAPPPQAQLVESRLHAQTRRAICEG
jgi:nicotinate phosphoribosyltransferase